MNKIKVRINFTNGLSFQDAPGDIFNDLLTEFELVHDTVNPSIVVFGPYGNDIPKGNFIRVGYFCENFIPDMTACEFGFGVPYESDIKHPNYCRIDFHGFDPRRLLKGENYSQEARSHHTHFCNFLYGNRVAYREKFFTELSKYKKVDAPGISMNNMAKLSTDKDQNLWVSKRNFIRKYKFTIAFENYTYPGYFTEKILDPMLSGSMPIYIGNPNIAQHFNTDSFIHGREFIQEDRDNLTLKLEQFAQPDYKDWRPSIYNSPVDKVRRKLKIWGRQYKLKHEFRNGFKNLIEEIIRLDTDDQAYNDKLDQPWLIQNQVPDRTPFLNQWRKILTLGAEKTN